MSENLSAVKSELAVSEEFHRKGVPLLVSSQLLRMRSMGQIDLARMLKDQSGWMIEIAEVKSSSVGEEKLLRGQRYRLFMAQRFLSAIFGHPSKLLSLIFKDR